MPLITNPEDLIRMYLQDSGATGLPGAMNESLKKMMAAPYAPGFVPASTAPQAPAMTEKDDRAKPRPLLMEPLGKLPGVQAPAAAPESAFSPETALASITKDEMGRRAAAEAAQKEALAKVSAAPVPAGAPAAPAAPVDPNAKPGGSFQAQDPTKFAETMLPHVTEALKGTNLDPRLVIAQAALETGYGGAAPGFNYFGIKSHGKSGGQDLDTTEIVDGKPVKMKQSFRTYKDAAESVKDYVKFLQENPRYAAVLAGKTLEEQIAAMGKSGYATDPNYAAKLMAIAQKIKLPGAAPPGPVTSSGAPYDPNAQPPSFMVPPPEPDTRARGGHIKDLLALSRNYQ